MNIRRAVPEDTDIIYELGKTVTEFAVTDNTVTFWPKSILDHAVRSDDIVMLVAEDDGVAGFLIAQYNDGLKKAVIENVYVHPDKRDRGIDDSLLKHALEVLREKGCEFVSTQVPSGVRTAVGLYEQNGFRRGEELFIWLDRSLAASYAKS
jgi:ribosomal protein S18 acetylase RimI-like enzyme